jgi:hypothetical protein
MMDWERNMNDPSHPDYAIILTIEEFYVALDHAHAVWYHFSGSMKWAKVCIGWVKECFKQGDGPYRTGEYRTDRRISERPNHEICPPRLTLAPSSAVREHLKVYRIDGIESIAFILVETAGSPGEDTWAPGRGQDRSQI